MGDIEQKDKAKVNLGMGFTINLGNFESARIDVGVEIQGNREDMPDLWKQAEAEISNQMNEQIVAFKAKLDNRKTLLGFDK